jgi:hypothetical protein
MSEIQISKTLLILKSTHNSTLSAENFLRNREWIVYSTTNLKEFLTHIIQKKPSFVMISVDHPNKKVLMMPKVLIQSFPVCVFTFAENSSSVSFRKLQDSQCLYRINPPATGPAIERMVNKYLKDQEKKLRDLEEEKNNPNYEAKSADGSNNTTMSFSQDPAADNSATSVAGSGWGQAASIFSQLLDDDGVKPNSSLSESGSLQSNGAGVIVAKGDKLATGQSHIETDQTSDHGSATSQGQNGKLSSGKEGSLIAPVLESEGDGKPKSNIKTLNPDYSGVDEVGDFKSSKASGQIADLNTKSNGEQSAGTLNGKTRKSGDSVSHNDNEDDIEQIGKLRKLAKEAKNIQTGLNKTTQKENSTAGAADDVRGRDLRSPKRYEKDQKIITIMGKNSGPRESIILKGTKQALDETAEFRDGNVKQELEGSSQVACIVVESEKFNGYLIAALGKDRKMDGYFIQAIQSKLFKFLKDNGEVVSEKDNMNLKIKKVGFEDWAIEYADFLKKSVHNGDEIAMAFFPVPNVRPEVGASAASTMASVKMSEIDGDKVVEFNMYIYLPNNKKYILYTPKGGTFYGNQKGRLQEKGVKEMHMLKSEIHDFSKYKAQNYLNGLIDGYKKKKANSSNAA